MKKFLFIPLTLFFLAMLAGSAWLTFPQHIAQASFSISVPAITGTTTLVPLVVYDLKASGFVPGDKLALSLGTKAPDFNLPDVVSGQMISLETFKDKKALLVIFMCRHCPYVQHVKKELAKIGQDYKNRDVGIVGISSNDSVMYPDDNPESLSEMAKELDFTFPLCFDETQEVAKNYTAACTPDIFLFDSGQKLIYRGQLDSSRPGNDIPVTGEDLRQALDSILEGKPVSKDQKPSSGCNIKWKKGNEPFYFGNS